jgi:hypothetical protein
MTEDFVDISEFRKGDLIIPHGLLFLIADNSCYLVSARIHNNDPYMKISNAIFLNKTFYNKYIQSEYRSDYVIDVFINSKIYAVDCDTAKFKKISYV